MGWSRTVRECVLRQVLLIQRMKERPAFTSIFEKLLEKRGFTSEPHWNLEEIVSMSSGLEGKKKIGRSFLVTDLKCSPLLDFGRVLNK